MKIVIGLQKSFRKDIYWFWKLSGSLIQWWTKSDYFHIELAIDGKWITSQTERGIEIREYNPNYFSEHFDYYELETVEITSQQKEKFWNWMRGEENTGYDWVGIYLTQIFKLDWEAKEKWFCSEMVARILQLLYVEEFIDCKPNRLSPNDIYLLLKDKMKKIEPKKRD